MLNLVPNVPESYNNISMLTNNLGLDKTLVANLKLCQIMRRLSSSAMPKLPCHICEWKRKEPFKEETLRTLGSLEHQYKNFSQSWSKEFNAKDFCNVNIPPLVQGEANDQLMIDYLSPLELHLMEGTVNHIYKHLEKFGGEKEVVKVSSMLNIS